jgi:iron(III) transport system permease protein
VPTFVIGVLYILLAFFLARQTFVDRQALASGLLATAEAQPVATGPHVPRELAGNRRWQVVVVVAGSVIGLALAQITRFLGPSGPFFVVGVLYLVLGALLWLRRRVRGIPARPRLVMAMGAYALAGYLVEFVARPIAILSRSIPPGFWANFLFQFSDYLKVFFQTPLPLVAIIYAFLSLLAVERERGAMRVVMATIYLALVAVLCFAGQPLALIGTPYIILAAFAVRSLPASVRAGVAALQQIDPSIEEASGMLGGDAQYTFRKVTLPLILPALLAGLIFAFTRHMTSLSAIIFLISARWRIVTASILSEWEQGGVSIAAAYSTIIIIIVLIAIGVLYYVTRRVLKGRGDVDLTLGA